ncbi:MAG: DEAD/DEAH box helicase, partial [Myxococcota bacterium]
MSRLGSPRFSLPPLKGLPLLAIAAVLRPTLPRVARHLLALCRSKPNLLGEELARAKGLDSATRKHVHAVLTSSVLAQLGDELALLERGVPNEREELVQFGEAHGVSLALATAASKVLGTSSVRGISRANGKGTLTLLDVASGGFQCAPSASPLDDLRRRGELLLEARRLLATEAYARRKWREAASCLDQQETVPELRALVDVLRAQCAGEPLQCLPDTPGSASLFDDELRYHEGKIEVRVDFTAEGTAPRLSCSCMVAACAHIPRGADAMLDLCLSLTEAEITTLVQRRSRPAWEFFLEELGRVAAPPRDGVPMTTSRAAYVLVADQAGRCAQPSGHLHRLPAPSEATPISDTGAIQHGPTANRGVVHEYLRGKYPQHIDGSANYAVRHDVLCWQWRAEGSDMLCGALITATTGTIVDHFPPDATELWVIHIDSQVVSVVPLSPAHHRLRDLLGYPGAAVPLASASALLERLVELETVIASRVPAALMGAEVSATPRVLVEVLPRAGEELHLHLRIQPHPGAGGVLPGEGEECVPGISEGRRVMVRRDFDEEYSLVERVRSKLAPLLAGTCDGALLVPSAHAATVIEIISSSADIVVEWPEGHGVFAPPAEWGVTDLSLVLRRGRDWLTVAGGPRGEEDFGTLLHLLEGARANRSVVALPNHGRVSLSAALLERLRAASIAMYPFGDEVRLGRGAVPLLDDSLRELLSAEGATDAWREIIQSHVERNVTDTQPPAAITAKLRPYQESGFAWLRENAVRGAGCVLADEMGLGKTLQTITLLQSRAAVGPTLIAAPTSLCFNWQRELARFAPQLRVHLFEGRTRQKRVESLTQGDVLVASYGVIVNDLETVARVRFGTAVFDEAQALKNPNARRTRAMRRIHAAARVAISGTPIENHLGELWSIFSVVQPSLLGPQQSFVRRFQGPIERDGDEAAHQSLIALISPYLLRRTKDEVA